MRRIVLTRYASPTGHSRFTNSGPLLRECRSRCISMVISSPLAVDQNRFCMRVNVVAPGLKRHAKRSDQAAVAQTAERAGVCVMVTQIHARARSNGITDAGIPGGVISGIADLLMTHRS